MYPQTKNPLFYTSKYSVPSILLLTVVELKNNNSISIMSRHSLTIRITNHQQKQIAAKTRRDRGAESLAQAARLKKPTSRQEGAKRRELLDAPRAEEPRQLKRQ